MKHIIWTNDLDYNDWKEDLEEEYPEKSEAERIEIMYEINSEFFYEEKDNLEEELGRPVVMLGSLGLWNGRRTGCKFTGGTNLNDIFYGSVGDIVTIFVENGEVMCKDIHHDGTNYYTYRVLKPGISEFEFEEYAYETSAEEAFEKYAEPLGNKVAKIYGWEIENAV